MSVLKDLIEERFNWGHKHRVSVAHHELLILVVELVILTCVVLLCVLHYESIFRFVAFFGG